MQNTNLDSPLISRFDLIFIVSDENTLEMDEQNCDFILEQFMEEKSKEKRADDDEI